MQAALDTQMANAAKGVSAALKVTSDAYQAQQDDQEKLAGLNAKLTDTQVKDLAKIADLKVISRTSASLYKSSNPHNSFFYLLTAAHVLHVLGGLAGLLYVIGKLKKSELRRSTLDAASRYWHFVDLLWVYLLLLLWMKV